MSKYQTDQKSLRGQFQAPESGQTRQCPKCEKHVDVKRMYCDCGYNIGYYYKFGVDHTPKKARLFFT